MTGVATIQGRATGEHAIAAQSLLRGFDAKPVTVLAAMSPQLPTALVAALVHEGRRRASVVTLLLADLAGRWDFLDREALDSLAAGTLRVVTIAGGVPRHVAGLTDHLPVSLWDVDRMIATGELPIDVFVARVAAGADQAQVSYGDMIGFSASALEVAEHVGFEVVPHRVVHPGTDGIPLARAEVVVLGSAVPTTGTAAGSVTAEQRAIGGHVARLVPDGATLQVGLGAVPAAVAAGLAGKADLGIHSGILPAGLQALITGGAATGRRKTRQRRRHVATGLLGGDPLAWGADVLLQPVSETHDPVGLLALESLWAVNSALEVDLCGQVNAEYAAGAKVASGGGQVDFIRAAHSCSQGASVVAIPSRTRTGTPRIVPRLGVPTTTPGSDVDYVVTEHGIARLRGASAAERADAIAAVAHPDDRRALREGGTRLADA